MADTDIRVIRTKKAIESAFIEILSEKSFSKITIEEICKKANINRMSFYNHYEDKYDLLNVIINSKMMFWVILVKIIPNAYTCI